MRVILLQDIEGLGNKYDIKEVKNGYARNFLIPKGLVKQATENALKWLETQKNIIDERVKQDLEKIQEKASEMDGLEVIISVKIGEKGELFEKINVQKIVEKIKELGFKVKKDQIELEKPFDELGEFSVKIKFEHNLETEIRVIIVEKKSK